MTTIHVQTQLSLDDLLHSLRQLDLNELERVERETALLRAQQLAPNLPQVEADLLLKINEGVVPAKTRAQCAALTAKARQGTITPEERAELMKLVDEIELRNAKRIGYLTRLASLRQLSLDDLMQRLELGPLAYE